MVSFPSHFPTKTLYTPLPHTRYMTCRSHSRFYHPNNIGWLQIIKPLLRSYQSISPGPRLSVWTFHDKILFFYGDRLLVLRPPPKLEDYPLSAVRDYFIFAATLHIGDRSSFRDLRTGINATEPNFNVYYVCPARRFLSGHLYKIWMDIVARNWFGGELCSF